MKQRVTGFVFTMLLLFPLTSRGQAPDSGAARPLFGVGLHGGFMGSAEAMSVKGVTFRYRPGRWFSLVATFEHQNYLFETDCGYHRNEAYSYGVAARIYPLGGAPEKALVQPYVKAGLVYSHLMLGGTDWNITPTEEVDYTTNALLAEAGAGLELRLFSLAHGR
ncbi:hypothetical protein KJ865_05835, partial [Myxococcota bacterium]|nr:hypothetical protein [Myxococcota bacterium]